MEVFINSQKIDVTLENEKTVGDVLKAFESEFEANNATTTGITVNGTEVVPDNFEECLGTPISDGTRIEISMIMLSDVKSEFKREFFSCSALAEKIKDISVNFQSGKDKEANALIAEVASLIDEFCRTARLAAYFPDEFSNFIADGIATDDGNKTVGDFFQDFMPILSDFEQAVESGDTVLIGDLAEYEISPRLSAIAKTLNTLGN